MIAILHAALISLAVFQIITICGKKVKGSAESSKIPVKNPAGDIPVAAIDKAPVPPPAQVETKKEDPPPVAATKLAEVLPESKNSEKEAGPMKLPEPAMKTEKEEKSKPQKDQDKKSEKPKEELK